MLARIYNACVALANKFSSFFTCFATHGLQNRASEDWFTPPAHPKTYKIDIKINHYWYKQQLFWLEKLLFAIT